MRREHKIGLYIGASLLSALLLYFFFFLQSQSTALDKVKATKENFSGFSNSIRNAKSALEKQKSPEVITPGIIGEVTEFNQQLNRTLTANNIESINKPSPIKNLWRDTVVTNYNSIISSNDFGASLDHVNGTVNKTRNFINYHYEVMQTFRNILEYNPREDLSITDTEGLLFTIRAAGTGIDRTLQKLRGQTYAGDAGLNELIRQLEQLETTRNNYELAIESGNPKGVEYDNFVTAVEVMQKNIITNRQLFWSANRDVLVIELDNAYKLLGPYQNQLNNL